MLKELRIKDFAIIGEAGICFGPGFNTFTGETGAGKSIIIGALKLALGDRASEEMIRSTADKATVEALFDISTLPGVARWLEDGGFEADNNELLIRRIVSRNGKSRAFINGALATVAQVRQAGVMLVDIHGQHDSQTLLNPAAHLLILDRFLGAWPQKETYISKREKFLETKSRLEYAQSGKHEKERRIDLLRHQVAEIQSAGLRPGEDETLALEKRKLSNAEKLIQTLSEAKALVDETEGSAASSLHRAVALMGRLVDLDETLAPVKSSLENALYQVEDAAGSVGGYLEDLHVDPDRLAQVDDRLDMIRQLKRKYGDTIEEILEYGAQAESELEELSFMTESLDKLKEQVELDYAEALEAAMELDNARKKGASEMSRAVGAQLASLNMERASFTPGFTEPEKGQDGKIVLGAEGASGMEFMFSANPGEPEKPLARIASGGEISRLMLAIKTVLPGDQPAATLVFDEIDTGMGGAAADTLGKKMKNLSEKCQVFCVTHLAQVARHADHHFLVGKAHEDQATFVTTETLSEERKVRELARMAGGVSEEQTAQAALDWARQALEGARKP